MAEEFGSVAATEPEGKSGDLEQSESPVDDDGPPTEAGDRLFPNYESQRSSMSVEDHAIKNRDKWGSKVEFLMASLSTSVGLGNVWRFPFTAKDNGGGAFLIPYIIILLSLGYPLYFVELSLGQFSSRGALGVWDMLPGFRGIAYAIIAISVCTVIFYAVILAWCALYLVHSFAEKQPWSFCDVAAYKAGTPDSIFTRNMTCDRNNDTGKDIVRFSFSDQDGDLKTEAIPPAVAFFKWVVLKESDHVSNGIGTPDWKLALCLLFIWILIFLNLMFGTKSFGKVAYFTALFPYSILFIFLGKVLYDEGSGDGIKYFFTPDFNKIQRIDAWFAAANQAFFSLGVGYGVITSYGSYNPFRQLPWTELTIVTMADMMTSILAGVIVFGTIGVLKHQTKAKEITDVQASGPGLAFITYPQVVANFETTGLPQLFGILFFSMFLTLGIGSGSGFVQVIMGAVHDNFPVLITKKLYKIGSVGIACFVLFLLGLVFTTPGGGFMIDFFNNYCSEWVVFVIVVFEAVGICWIYGFKAYILDLKYMFSVRHQTCSFICSIMKYWGYILPLVLLLMLGLTFANIKPIVIMPFGRLFPSPSWEKPLGWTLWGMIVSLIPLTFVATFARRRSRKWKNKLLATIRPSAKWGPKDPAEKDMWIAYRRIHEPATLLYRLSIGKAFVTPRTPVFTDESEMNFTGEGSNAQQTEVVNRDKVIVTEIHAKQLVVANKDGVE